jgi:hypothetical protein
MVTDNKKLLRLSLQFFGEDDDNAGEDFDDEFFEDEDYEDEEQDTETDADDENAESGTDESDTEDDSDSGAADGGTDNDTGTDADLISELRALGYVGNDLASLTKDMKAKREAKAAADAKAEGAAAKAEGKSHVKSSRPGKSASGDGTGGITERQVDRFVSITKASRESARQTLSKHARLIEGH